METPRVDEVVDRVGRKQEVAQRLMCLVRGQRDVRFVRVHRSAFPPESPKRTSPTRMARMMPTLKDMASSITISEVAPITVKYPVSISRIRKQIGSLVCVGCVGGRGRCDVGG